MSKIQDEKKQFGKYAQYLNDKAELQFLLIDIKVLRHKINKYEKDNSNKK